MKTITITCTNCQKQFERLYKQYKHYNLKKGMKIFCSRGCKTTHTNLSRNAEWYSKNVSTDQLIPGNRKDEYSPFKYFITKCKERKKHSNIDFDIDLSYLKDLWNTQLGICPYTGLKMDLPETTRIHSSVKSLKKASLDRIDSSKGYIKGNVEFVCLLINFAKNTYSKNEVVDFISELKMVGKPGIAPETQV